MRQVLAVFIAVTFLFSVRVCHGKDHIFGGSIRGYGFVALEKIEGLDYTGSGLFLGRATQESYLGDLVLFEAHGLLSALAPPQLGGTRIAVSPSRAFLPLQTTLADKEDILLIGSLDRLNLQFEFDRAKIVVGRQAITWGVSYFWPAVDLFAPFAPQQIDREYKAGLDAVRLVLPLNNFSELEVVGAVLGSSFKRDGSGAALLRWNFGSADLGVMGGRFHRDTVVGGFVTADLKGTGVRAEVNWTKSGDPEDEKRDRESFLRTSVGFDRQLTSSLSLVSELAWNGYGTTDPSQYLDWLDSDRVLRGEVNCLGRVYAGGSLAWMIHPLLTLTNTFLVNIHDPSTLWIPSLVWSTGNNSEVLIGGQLSMGRQPKESEGLESEYGSVPSIIFGSFKLFF